MYASHKVVAYPTAALRQSRLGVHRSDSSTVTKSNTSKVDSSCSNENYPSNIAKVKPEFKSRPRSLSTGRTRQSSTDLVQDVYNRLGVSRQDLGCCEESLPFPKGSSSTPATTPDNFPSQVPQTTSRGRSRQPTTLVGMPVPDSPDRRSRSLSIGRIRTLWPPTQDLSENSTSAKRSIRNSAISNTVVVNGSSSHTSSTNGKNLTGGTSSVFEWKDEKKEEYDPMPDSSSSNLGNQRNEKETMLLSCPSIKERMRVYVENLAPASERTLEIKSTVTGQRTKFENCNEINTVNAKNESNSCFNKAECQMSFDVDGFQQGGIGKKAAAIGSTDSSIRKVHVNGRSDCRSALAAINSSSTTTKDINCTPVLEIQTSKDGVNGDAVSISMSSVSGEEFSRTASVDVINSPSQPIIGITHVPTKHSGAGYYRYGSSSTDTKKFVFPERDRLSTYKYSKSVSREISVAVEEKCTPIPNQYVQNDNVKDSSQALERIVDQVVNARMAEYEMRMEKVIMKFMQTVDEKMSQRIKTFESKINQINAALRKVQEKQEQQLLMKNDYVNVKQHELEVFPTTTT